MDLIQKISNKINRTTMKKLLFNFDLMKLINFKEVYFK